MNTPHEETSVSAQKNDTPIQKNNRKEYYREQKRKYRQKHRTVSISFTKEAAKALTADAKAHHLSLPKYIKACAEAYRNQTFIVPDLSQVRSLELQLKGIGNNINQIARLVNSRQTEAVDGVEQVKQQLKQLEQQFNGIIRSPWNLEMYIRESMKVNRYIPFMLQSILVDYMQDLHHANKKNNTQESAISNPTSAIHD